MTNYELLLAEDEFVADAQMYLLNLMQNQGVTKAELASRLGVSRSAVSQLFSLEPSNLSMKKFARVAAALGSKVSVASQVDVDSQRQAQTELWRDAEGKRASWIVLDALESDRQPANENNVVPSYHGMMTEQSIALGDTQKKFRAVRQYA